jgi:hypothetical protein
MALPNLKEMYFQYLKGEVTFEDLRLATDEVVDEYVRRGWATPPELSHPDIPARPPRQTPTA